MCGLFGMIRNTNSTREQHDTASRVVTALGIHAMERGTDSSGIATFSRSWEFTADSNHAIDTTCSTYVNGPFAVTKAPKSFMELLTHDTSSDMSVTSLVSDGDVVLGHTRWATQGSVQDLANCSPMAVGHLIGTHNGDITPNTVPGYNASAMTAGTTDTEALYTSLNRDRQDTNKVVDVLANTQGRIALAWMDLTDPEHVFLARGALSPLAVAFDTAGNMYWASNPNWFRQIAESTDVEFASITMVREGLLVTVDISDGTPRIVGREEFVPVCRAKDERSANTIAWRGFVTSDADADKAQRNHMVAPAPKSSYTIKSSQPDGFISYWDTPEHHFEDSRYTDDYDTSNIPGLNTTEVMDEAIDALLEWADTGENPKVPAELEAIVSHDDARAFAKKYQLSGTEVVYELRNQMRFWVEQDREALASA